MAYVVYVISDQEKAIIWCQLPITYSGATSQPVAIWNVMRLETWLVLLMIELIYP